MLNFINCFFYIYGRDFICPLLSWHGKLHQLIFKYETILYSWNRFCLITFISIFVLVCNVAFFLSCFQHLFLYLWFPTFDYDVARHNFLWIYTVWDLLQFFESVNVCGLLTLGVFSNYLLTYFFSIHLSLLSLWDYIIPVRSVNTVIFLLGSVYFCLPPYIFFSNFWLLSICCLLLCVFYCPQVAVCSIFSGVFSCNQKKCWIVIDFCCHSRIRFLISSSTALNTTLYLMTSKRICPIQTSPLHSKYL